MSEDRHEPSPIATTASQIWWQCKTLSSKTTTFGYGAAGQLTQIFYPSNPGNPFVTTVYDSLGRASRHSDAVGNTTTLFFAGARSETDDPAGTARVSYFSQPGRTLATIQGLGSPGIHHSAGT